MQHLSLKSCVLDPVPSTLVCRCDVLRALITIMDKVLRYFCILGRFPIHTGPTPPLTPQTKLDACMQNFLRVSTLYMVGGGRTARKSRKGYTVLRGNREMTEKYEYCSTFPRTFDQDCRLINMSLIFGQFPVAWKEALVLPLLKKPGLDILFKYFRPASNLRRHLNGLVPTLMEDLSVLWSEKIYLKV